MIEALKRLLPKRRGPVFEVKQNAAGDWFWHELAGGKIVDVSQAFCPGSRNSKSHAKRAAIRKAATTAKATWRFAK
jgi:hypothetical protein